MTCPITGIRASWGPNNAVPARREIDKWYTSSDAQDKDQVNLYIQALINFQNLHANEKLSFFQVAGIHGQPLVPWDEDSDPVTAGTGYCTHSSILFPTWHRPYMLLYEQRIYEEMKKLVPQDPQSDQARLNAACDSWRLPYWDWAAQKPQASGNPTYSVPQIVTLPRLDVLAPSGNVENVANPMYKFTMPDGQTMGQQGIGNPSLGIPFENTKGTSRWSPSTDDDGWTEGVENNDDIAATLRDPNSDPGDWTEALGTIADAVYRLFTAEYVTNYEAFATTRFGPKQPPQDYISLEGVHNVIHDMTGGFSTNANGHMAAVPVAAFDPIFWLHHCNVDRYLAIFLALRESDWFDNPDQALTDPGTWSIPSDSIDTPQTDLAPFHNQDGNYFKSDDVRQTFALGYTYPELQPWDPENQTNGQFDPVKYKGNINAQLTRLYDHHTQLALQTASEAIQPEAIAPQLAKAAQKAVPQAAAGETHRVAPDAKATHDDYFVNVLYDKFALGGHPFKIHLYFDLKSVGSVFNFSTPANTIGRDRETGCINCHQQDANHIQVTGQVPITNALRKAPGVEVTDRDSLLAYLREKLDWTVTSYYGDRVPPENAGQFITVSVARGQGTHYVDDRQLSQYSDYEYLPHVTNGKHGGLQA